MTNSTRLLLIALLATLVGLTVISFAATAAEPRLRASLGAIGACVIGIAGCLFSMLRAPRPGAVSAIGGCAAGIGGCVVSIASAMTDVRLTAIGVCIAAIGGLVAAPPPGTAG